VHRTGSPGGFTIAGSDGSRDSLRAAAVSGAAGVPPPSSIGASTSAAGSPSAGSLASSDIGSDSGSLDAGGGDGFSDSPTKVSPEAAGGERQGVALAPGPGAAGPAGGDGRAAARAPSRDSAPGGRREPLPAAAAVVEAAARLNATLRTPSPLRRAARERAAAVADPAPEPAGPRPGPEPAPAGAPSGTPFAAPVVQLAAGGGAGAGAGAAAAAGAAAVDKPVTPVTPASAAASPFQSAARLGSFGSGALEADAGAGAPAPGPPAPKPAPWCGSCHASVADRAPVRRSASLPRALPPVDEAPGCEASAAAHEAQARATPAHRPASQSGVRGGPGTAALWSWCGGRGAGARGAPEGGGEQLGGSVWR